MRSSISAAHRLSLNDVVKQSLHSNWRSTRSTENNFRVQSNYGSLPRTAMDLTPVFASPWDKADSVAPIYVGVANQRKTHPHLPDANR